VRNYRKEIEVFWLILFTAVDFGANLAGIATDCTDNTDKKPVNSPLISSNLSVLSV